MYIKGHVETVDTKDQSNAIMYCVCYVVCWLLTQKSKHAMHWIVYAMLFVDTVDTKTLMFVALTYSTYISVHNFLNIQLIFNPKKVLESSESGLFNCIDSVNIASTFWLITSLIFNWFLTCLKFWKAQNQGFSTVSTVSTCIALNVLYFVYNAITCINSVNIYSIWWYSWKAHSLSFPKLFLDWK